MSCLNDKSITILAWMEGDWSTEEDADRVLKWIEKGGGFLHGLNPAKWIGSTPYVYLYLGLCSTLLLLCTSYLEDSF